MRTVSDLSVSNGRFVEGVWQAVLVASDARRAPPDVEVTHMGTPLVGMDLVPDPEVDKLWTITVPIPASLVSEGVQTFLLRDGSGVILARFAISAGSALAEDLLAEVDLLRAELDLLKQAFRRHCVESADS